VASDACAASEACTDAVEEVGEKVEGVVNSVADDDDEAAGESAPYDDLSDAKEECPTGDYWDGLNKEIGDRQQEMDRAGNFVDKLGHSDPNRPSDQNRVKRAAAAIAKILDPFN
jgi:ferredoxin